MDEKTPGFIYGFNGDKLMVRSIYKNSEAGKKGIKIGTEIFEINNFKISELTRQQICDYNNNKFILVPKNLDKVKIVFETSEGEIKTEELTMESNFNM